MSREFDIYRLELCGSSADDWTQLQPTFTFSSVPSPVKEDKTPLKGENDYRPRQVSAYSIYFKERLPTVKSQYPSANFGDYSRLIAAAWESLTQQRKSVGPLLLLDTMTYTQTYQQKAQRLRKELIRSAAVEAVRKIAIREPLKPINNSNK